MKLQEAYELVLPMRESTINIEKETVANKGKFGHALEKFLELNLGSHHLDFEDGDLKVCAIRNGKIKEDFKICKKWDKQYILEKLKNILLVVYDYDTGKIDSVQQLSILDHPIVRKQFDIDLDYILSQPDPNLVSQSETDVFVAKTNDTGNKEVNQRACYIAGAPAGYLFGYGYSSRARKGKQFVKEMEKYEQTETGGTA
jgi:hypothetical protein